MNMAGADTELVWRINHYRAKQLASPHLLYPREFHETLLSTLTWSIVHVVSAGRNWRKEVDIFFSMACRPQIVHLVHLGCSLKLWPTAPWRLVARRFPAAQGRPRSLSGSVMIKFCCLVPSFPLCPTPTRRRRCFR